MKMIKMVIVMCCVRVVTFAGDTNFVAQFNAIWQTHNASNILMFVEQNVATNKSPETLFARGSVSGMLQGWTIGTTNYWEQAINIISTNTVYSESEKGNVIKEIRGLQSLMTVMPADPQPSWNTARHAAFFAEVGDEAPFLDTLKKISTIESAKTQ